MAYIGQNADGNFTTSVSKDTFSGNGSTTAFTLSEGATTNTVDVFVENIRQEPTTAYTVDGTTLTFTAAPVTGTDNIYVVNRGPIQLSASHPAAQALTAHSATITTDLTVDTNTLFVDSTNNNVFVGKSSSDIGTTGIELQGGNDRIFVTRSGDSTLYLNRTTSDGSVLEVLKDDTTVGVIGTQNWGIGTSSPTSTSNYSTLDIRGTTGGQLLLGRSAQVDLYAYTTDTLSTIGTGIGTSLRFLTNSSGASNERMRIDSSGNLLVGTTNTVPGVSNSDTGIAMSQANGIIISRSSEAPINANRASDDGDIILLRQGGEIVGSIGSASSGTDLYISGSGTRSGVYFNVNGLLPMVGGNLSDNTEDLGQTGYRWRDLYLSGGAYLGGTGSANKLDDYEEGTWTPSNSYVTLTVNSANYVTVGNITILRFDISFPTNSNSNNANITGLPVNSPSYNGGFTHWSTYGAGPPLHISGTTMQVQNPAAASNTLQLQNLSGKRIIGNAVISMT